MPAILSIGELLDLGNSAATAGLIPYSALDYDGTGRISGISGSAIAGGVDSAVVSSIVSSYVSSKVDQSAFDVCCSSVQSALSGKLDASASGQFAPSGDYYSASNPSGFITSGDLSSKLDASASSLFQPSGDYYSASNPSGFITGVDLSEYQEKSGMTAYQPVGDYYSASNPSGFITGVDLSDYAKESSLSSKLDASASGQFQLSGDYVYESSYSSFSGDVVNNISSMSSIVSGLTGDYLEKSASGMFAPSGDYALSSDVSGVINTVSSNSAEWGQGGADYSGISPVIVDNDERTIGVSSTPLAVDSATMREYDQGGIHYFGVKSGVFAETGDLTGYVPVSAISAESSQWNNISSLSSYVLSSSLSAYALSSSLTAYVPKSAISARSGTWNTVSGRIPYSALEYDADSAITAISGSAIGSDITKVIAYSALEYDADSAITAISGSAIGSDISNVIPYSALGYNGDKISGISGSAIEADSWHVSASSISANYLRADIDGLQVFYTPKPVTSVSGAPSAAGETASAVGVGVNVINDSHYGAGLFTVPDVSTSFAPIPAECYRSASGVREWTITGVTDSAHRLLYATDVVRTNPDITSLYSAKEIYTSEELSSDTPYTIYTPWSASSIIVWESGIYAISPPTSISASSTVSVDYANIKKYSNDSAVVVPDIGNLNTALLSADPNYFTVDNATVGGSAVNLLSMYNTGRTLGYVSSRNSAYNTITITAEQSSLAINNIVTNINTSRCLDISLLISSPYSSLWALVQVDDAYNHETLAVCSVPSGNSATVQMHAYTYGFANWNHATNQYANKDTYIEVYGVPTGTVITAHTAIVQMTDGPISMKYFKP